MKKPIFFSNSKDKVFSNHLSPSSHNNGCYNHGLLIKFRVVDEDINWISDQWILDVHSNYELIEDVTKR